jgi:anaerobic selenocysteine-containing dehydrogenase
VANVTAARVATSATLSDLDAGEKLDVPLADAYSLRVNLSRRLYDNGVAVQGSPALANLKASSTLRLNHFDLDRLGVATGDVVDVSGPRGTVRLPVALDDDVPRGVIEIAFGSIDETGVDVVRPLFDGVSLISQVRLDTK